MTNELKKLRRELETTKSALQAQAARCRQLVAAFTRKLQEKEKELRKSNDLRDRQLACVLRSLLVLESRLRKEQKIIRQQLVEKDRVIAQQSSELAQLRPNSPDQSSGESRLDDLCHRSIYKETPLTENAYRDNPVLESVQQILLKDEEDLLTVQPVDNCDKNAEVGVAWYETDSTVLATEQQQQQQKRDSFPAWCKNQEESWTALVPDPRDKDSSGAWCIKVIEADEEPPPTNGHERLWVKDKPAPTKAQHLEEKACLQMAKKNLAIAVPKDLDEIEANSITVLECSYQELSPVTLKPQQQQQQQQKQKPPALPPKPSRLLKPSEILKRSGKPETQPKPRVHVQEIKRKQMNGHVPGNAKPQPAVKEESLPDVQSEILDTVKKKTDSPPTKPRSESTEAAIRIGSSVSSLITGSSRESIVTELTTTPEDGLQENFEEFKLEECYVEADGRPEADGAEMNHYAAVGPVAAAPEATRTYETFLETTGLSQKSILTPSRMLSNHRSCLKPKDVKHRSRIKAAAVGVVPTVKYWTEPFL